MQFSDIITFTRASGGGRFNAQGQYEWLPADQPRFDFDPVTGKAKGLLVEESRTNLLTYSSDFANTAWVKQGASIESNATTSPDGTADADKLTEDSTDAQHRVIRNVAAGAGTYSLTVRAKSAGRSSCRLYLSDVVSAVCFAVFNIATGEILTTEFGAAWTGGKATITPLKGGWFECTISATSTNSTSTQKQIAINTYFGTSNYPGDGTSGIYIWGAQLEVGSFPTSYIPTTTAQVTRAADNASVNTLTPWFNEAQGTLLLEAIVYASGALAQLASLDNGTASSRIQIRHTGTTGASALISSSGVVTVNMVTSSGAWPSGVVRSSALAWDGDGAALVAGGGSPVTDDSVVLPTVTRLSMASPSVGVAPANCHIRAIRYYPRRLSNAELQALTT